MDGPEQVVGQDAPAQRPIYLDYQATTPVDERVFEAMRPTFTQTFGNPASSHSAYGEPARAAVEEARLHVARLFGADEQDVIFTSGATESNNLAIKGVAAAAPPSSHFVTCATEHKSVIDVFAALEAAGHRVTYLDVDAEGGLDLDALMTALRQPTVLVSLMVANNEIGTIHPVAEAAQIAHSAGALFHTDATQAAGHVPLDLRASSIDMMSLSAHKIYGPKGCGALIVRREIQRRLAPLVHGGNHERGLRSGTINVPGCVGFGAACQIMSREGSAEADRLAALAWRLESRLRASVDDVALNGPDLSDRLRGNLNVRITGVPADALSTSVPTVAFSTGSACTSAAPAPSHVLRACGFSHEEAESSIRLSVGRFTTEPEVDAAAALIASAAGRIRSLVHA